MAEFVLMSTLLLFLLFGVAQTALYVYARNITAAAAADGARYAATAGTPADTGGTRAGEVVRSALHAGGAGISCSGRFALDARSDLDVVTVRCTGRIRSVFVPLGALLAVDVSASALRERAP